VWASTSSARFADRRSSSLDATYLWLLAEAAPELARSIKAAAPVGPLRAFPGRPGWIRASAGPGWALVGDAGYFKDPITAHGITDALRDAELLARAVLGAPRGDRALRDAVGDYERTRDRLSRPLFDITEQIADYSWDLAELRGLLRELSEAMRPEVATLRAFDQTTAA
jgi:flavin-dependent dehydrogenase